MHYCTKVLTVVTIMNKKKFRSNITSPFRMGTYLFWKLPAAWFMGVRIVSCDDDQCTVKLPYGWRSQNPFRSTYFAAQCAAGEMSTGLPALAAIQDGPPVSMLVVKFEAEFYKKANQTLLFTFNDVQALEKNIAAAREGAAATEFKAESVGKLPDGTVATRVWVTWS
ncbi:MAG: DUF4442 domain-containing protein, partial [Saprospiraceae bacterium]|nr:DUF4442 domain-containing protein [Saprospiraceae bacterium]